MRNARRLRCALLLLVGTGLVGLYVLFRDRGVKPSTARRTSGPPLMLMWTPFFDGLKWSMDMTLFTCKAGPTCLRTSNRSAVNASALVVFHLSDVRVDDLPDERPQGQLWALLTEEPPVYEPWLPESLQGAINWTATYRPDSDLTLLPQLQEVPYDLQPKNWWANKSRQALWLVSNCKTLGNREGFVRELSKFVEVDVVGTCGTMVASCLPKMSDECYRQASETYYYYLALENSICTDYVTEKFFNALRWGIIPVVLGGADYSRVAPSGSYIDALAFRNVRHLADHMKRTAQDMRLYNSYHAWRLNYSYIEEELHCGLCRMLHDTSTPVKAYSNFNEWWFRQAHCYTWKAQPIAPVPENLQK